MAVNRKSVRWTIRRSIAPFAPSRGLGVPGIRRHSSRSEDQNVSPNWWRLIDWLKIVTLCCTAGWIFFQYIRHEREQRDLALEIQRVNRDIAVRSFEFDLKSKEFVSKQQELTAKISEITAAAEADRIRLGLEGQRLANGAAATAAKFQSEREKLSLSILELDRNLKGVELVSAGSNKILGSTDLVVTCGRDGNTYGVQYKVDLQNISDKKSVEVTWELRWIFLGRPSNEIDQQSIDLSVVRLNDPPDPYLGVDDGGTIDWIEYGVVGYMYPNTAIESILKKLPFYFRSGGLVTKLLQPKDKSYSSSLYDVKAPPGHWIAVVARFGVDGAVEGSDIYKFSNWTRLPECVTQNQTVH